MNLDVFLCFLFSGTISIAKGPLAVCSFVRISLRESLGMKNVTGVCLGNVLYFSCRLFELSVSIGAILGNRAFPRDFSISSRFPKLHRVA